MNKKDEKSIAAIEQRRDEYFTSYYEPSDVQISDQMVDKMAILAFGLYAPLGQPVDPVGHRKILISYVKQTVAMEILPAQLIIVGDSDDMTADVAHDRIREVGFRAVSRVRRKHTKLATKSNIYTDKNGKKAESKKVGQQMITACTVAFLDGDGVRLGYSVWRPKINQKGKIINPFLRPVARNTAILRGLATDICVNNGVWACSNGALLPNDIVDSLQLLIARARLYFKEIPITNLKEKTLKVSVG